MKMNFLRNFGIDWSRLPGPIGGAGSSFFPRADFGGMLPELMERCPVQKM